MSLTDSLPRPPRTGAMPEILTGSGAILRTLELLGIRDVFGLPGGAIMPFYDELMSSTSIRPNTSGSGRSTTNTACPSRASAPAWAR